MTTRPNSRSRLERVWRLIDLGSVTGARVCVCRDSRVTTVVTRRVCVSSGVCVRVWCAFLRGVPRRAQKLFA